MERQVGHKPSAEQFPRDSRPPNGIGTTNATSTSASLVTYLATPTHVEQHAPVLMHVGDTPSSLGLSRDLSHLKDERRRGRPRASRSVEGAPRSITANR